MNRVISIAENFSRYPAGRYRTDGPFPGEAFREDLLAPALRGDMLVTVLMDGGAGYGSGFLEEAFGGLVRMCGFTSEELHSKLFIATADPDLVTEIWDYIDSAQSLH